MAMPHSIFPPEPALRIASLRAAPSEPVPSAAALGRRALPRVAVSLPAHLQVAGLPASLRAQTRDVSAGGVCVTTPSPFAVADLRSLTLLLPTEQVELAAEGRWQREVSGEDAFLTGIRLLDVPDTALERIWDLVHEQSKSLTRWLGKQPAFAALGLQALMDLAHVTRLRDARAGQLLYRQGTPDDSIFIVTHGEVVFEQRTRRERKIAVGRAGPGDLVGGAGVVAGLVPSESAIASRNTSLLEISRGAFQNLQQTNAALAFGLVSIVLQGHLSRIEAALHRLVDDRR